MINRRKSGVISTSVMLMLVAVVACSMTLWARSARETRKAIGIVKQFGGRSDFYFEVDPLTMEPNAQGKPRFARLSRIFGLEWFNSLINVDLADCEKLSDSEVALVSRCNTIQYLNLSDTSITDRSLQYVASLRRLKFLGLCNTKVSKQALEQLLSRGSYELKGLTLDGLPIDDSFVDRLLENRDIKYIAISGTDVSELGVQKLNSRNCFVDQ